MSAIRLIRTGNRVIVKNNQGLALANFRADSSLLLARNATSFTISDGGNKHTIYFNNFDGKSCTPAINDTKVDLILNSLNENFFSL